MMPEPENGSPPALETKNEAKPPSVEQVPVSQIGTTETAPSAADESSSPKKRRRHIMTANADHRRSHGVQFQKQFESLAISSGNTSSRFLGKQQGGSSKNAIGGSFTNSNHDPTDSEINENGSEDEVEELSLFEKCIDAWQFFRYQCGLIVNAKDVQVFMVYLIALNAIMMGIATFSFVKDNEDVEGAFEYIDLAFLIIFSVELAMQFAFYGWRLVLDGWLVFDTIIITLSWSLSQAQVVRAFRIFRAFRLITRIKVLKNLVLALFGVVPRMFAIGILLMLVSYIFAVMFTQLFKDLYEENKTDDDYFGRMDRTFFTLFQIMTLDAWADIARQVMDVYAWAWLPFIVFVITTGFVVVNLIIAVICDAIAALHDDEKAKLHGTYLEEFEEEAEDGSSDVDSSEDGAKSKADAEEHDEYQLEADVRVQLGSLEKHVEELARMQEDALMTLDLLTQHIEERRLTFLPLRGGFEDQTDKEGSADKDRRRTGQLMHMNGGKLREAGTYKGSPETDDDMSKSVGFEVGLRDDSEKEDLIDLLEN